MARKGPKNARSFLNKSTEILQALEVAGLILYSSACKRLCLTSSSPLLSVQARDNPSVGRQVSYSKLRDLQASKGRSGEGFVNGPTQSA